MITPINEIRTTGIRQLSQCWSEKSLPGYALFDIGEAYFNLEDYDNAFENYKKSLYIAIEEQDSVMQRSCLSNIAMACSWAT